MIVKEMGVLCCVLAFPHYTQGLPLSNDFNQTFWSHLTIITFEHENFFDDSAGIQQGKKLRLQL